MDSRPLSVQPIWISLAFEISGPKFWPSLFFVSLRLDPNVLNSQFNMSLCCWLHSASQHPKILSRRPKIRPNLIGLFWPRVHDFWPLTLKGFWPTLEGFWLDDFSSLSSLIKGLWLLTISGLLRLWPRFWLTVHKWFRPTFGGLLRPIFGGLLVASIGNKKALFTVKLS